MLFICAPQLTGSEIEITEKLTEHIPENINLINENGDTVDLLKELTVPSIINFVYFNCPGICSPLLTEIQNTIEVSDLKIGEEYQFITISFDPSETTDLAVSKKTNYINGMQKRIEAVKGWKFFTGDSLNLAKATNSLGFNYKKVGNEFIHKACMIVVNQEGKIIRYNMGLKILPQELKISVIEAAKGNPLPRTYKQNEYCFPFVAPAYQRLNTLAKQIGIVVVILASVFFLYLVLKPKISK